MRVLIDMSFARRGPSGTASYLHGLTTALRNLDDVEVVEASQPRRLPPGRKGRGRNPARSAANWALDASWLGVGIAAAAARANADVIHHPLPAHSLRSGRPQVVTVQDLAFERFPAHFDPWWRLVARRRHLSAARRADAVVCISAGTARDARSRWGLDPSRIVVAHPAVSAPESGRATRRKGKGAYALYVGDAEPRKNLPALISAWRSYREHERRSGRSALDLVLAGRGLGDRRNGLREPGLRLVHAPAPGELDRLLAEASALVHPSLHEGFGLTMLEAMAHGLPVVCARAPGSVEICGNAALYFDPRDPNELATRLREVSADAGLRRKLAKGGRARAAELTWAESAKRHREAYVLALGSSGP